MSEVLMPIRVVLANTTFRFYTDCGWTRKDVAAYLNSKDISYVIPRWLDPKKDKKLTLSFNQLDNNEAYKDCDYFSIYSLSKEAELNIEQLKDNHIVDLPGETQPYPEF